jgi:hypothetical protein
LYSFEKITHNDVYISRGILFYLQEHDFNSMKYTKIISDVLQIGLYMGQRTCDQGIASSAQTSVTKEKSSYKVYPSANCPF